MKIGDRVDPPVGHPQLGDFGLMTMGAGGAHAKTVGERG